MQHESMEQRAVVSYCHLRKIPIFAIPNGGKRNRQEAYFMKLEGTSAGVPDLCIPVPNKKYHGLYIEMKYGKNKPTQNQIKWIDYLNSVGYLAIVCYGHNDAITHIDNYLKIGK